MNLEYLNTYLIVIREGSFSKAAKKLFLTQPAISAQIKKLEQEVGVRLIERGRTGVTMTPAGRTLLNFSEYVKHQYSYLLRDIANSKDKTLEELTIITSPVCGEYVLPGILNEYRETHALSGANIKIADSIKVVEDVQNGIYDIGSCGIMVESSGLEIFKIAEYDIVLILYPGHPLSDKKEVLLSDLSGESIVLREPLGVKVGDTKMLTEAGLDLYEFKQRFVTGSMAGLLSLVESRAGIAFLPYMIAKKGEALGLIKIAKVKEINLKREYIFLIKKGKERSRVSNEFMDFIKTKTIHKE
ncbi:LysR substrate-binding domain-containing protein [Chloroflexota bacterium]